MSVSIEIGGVIATVNGYEWKCRSKPMEDWLNSLLDPLGPSGADPNPDLSAALEAIAEAGTGEIVARNQNPDDGKIDFKAKQ